MILCVTGIATGIGGGTCVANSGKSSVADRLCRRHSFVEIALADPLKRFLQSTFEFTDDQLWGPSALRDMSDDRYPCPALGGEGLTPRYALQSLGHAWGRRCYEDVWLDVLLRTINRLQNGGYSYQQRRGLIPCAYIADDPIRPKTNVVVSDLRYKNEAEALRKAGAKLVRVRRQVISPTGASEHASETELCGWDDAMFDFVIENSGGLDTLNLKTDSMLDLFLGKVCPYDETQADVPPCLRK